VGRTRGETSKDKVADGVFLSLTVYSQFYFKRSEIIIEMFSEHNRVKLEISNRKLYGKYLEIEKTFLNNPWVKEETQGKLENILN